MKNTLVRLKVRREVVRMLTRRELAIAVGGADNPNGGATDHETGCKLQVALLPTE